MIDFKALVLRPVLDVFGGPAGYIPPGGGEAAPLEKAVLDENHEFIEQDDVEFSTTSPAALVDLADFPEGVSPKKKGRIQFRDPFLFRGGGIAGRPGRGGVSAA